MELKNLLENNTIPSDFMIFVKKDCPFLANQYITAITDRYHGTVKRINSIYEPTQSSIAMLTNSDETINILNVDTFSERAEDYSVFSHIIVICEKVDKDVLEQVKDFIIDFPKLENWQILDFIKGKYPNLDEQDLKWLVTASNGNIDLIINELDKIAIFPKEKQRDLFSSICFDLRPILYKPDIFKLTDALIDGDFSVLYECLLLGSVDNIEPVVLVNRAALNLKNIILATQNSKMPAEAIGISAGQFRFFTNKYRSLNIEAARQKLKFLTAFDLKLKNSYLELNKRDMLNYIINNLSYKITL
jgi:DNA polymerase III delta subunit